MSDRAGPYCRNRMQEWVAGAGVYLTGLMLLVWPTAFAQSQFSPILDILPVSVIMPLCLVSGLARLLALYHNGAWPYWGPIIRAGAALIGAALLVSMGVALLVQVITTGRPMSPGVCWYTPLAIAELITCYRAASDVRYRIS